MRLNMVEFFSILTFTCWVCMFRVTECESLSASVSDKLYNQEGSRPDVRHKRGILTESTTVVCDPEKACLGDTGEKYCFNGGSCEVNMTSCTPVCLCKAGFTGQRCASIVSIETGSVDSSSTALVTTPAVPNCPFDYCKMLRDYCHNGGICFLSPTCKNYCQCQPGFTGNRCYTKIETTTLSLSSNDTTSKERESSISTSQQSLTGGELQEVDRDACSSKYTMRPSLEQQCKKIPITCKYGYCNETETDNGLSAVCWCDHHAVGSMCEDKCCLDCVHGQCSKYDNKTFCSCLQGYNGTYCEKKIVIPEPEKETWYIWVIGSTSVVMVLLLVALVIIPYLMWKRRVTPIMKLVHYFQPYEDDDDRQWDAFVSYKSSETDQAFVLQTLLPKLEQEMGFSLCLHFRNFLPGDTIANNIINAIDNSRRTILILSPRYVQSEFTRFEYQVAQHEMLKRKHRIIPILLEDISSLKDCMDPNLRQLIKSVTYLEYPGAESSEKKMKSFWKRLELSMPKKKSRSNVESASTLVPVSIQNKELSEARPIKTFWSPSTISASSKTSETSCTSTSTNDSGVVSDLSPTVVELSTMDQLGEEALSETDVQIDVKENGVDFQDKKLHYYDNVGFQDLSVC